jgi:CubicO group peptidase (beta-lactamase class C family)
VKRAVALVVAAIALAAGAPAQAEPVDRRIARFLDRTLPEDAKVAVAAARHGRLVHCTRCDTAYDIGSNTKQFTAAAIVKLEAMGRLRTTDRLSRFIGPVPDDKRAITLRHLLTHTAGLPESLGGDYDPLTREAMLAGALGSELRSPPGRAMHYSNVGYSVLAAVVEQVSGMGYEQFLATHLFAPAGMRQTGYVLPRWRRVAVEYDRHGAPQGRPFDHPWAADGPYWNLRGNGGLLSTPRDMFRWHRALDGGRVLTRRARRELFAPRVAIGSGVSYGYGWDIVRRSPVGRVAAHNGGNGWSYSELARLLDRGSMVFWVTNRSTRAGHWSLEHLSRRLTRGLALLVA